MRWRASCCSAMPASASPPPRAHGASRAHDTAKEERVSSKQVQQSAEDVDRLVRGESDHAEVWADVGQPRLIGYASATDVPRRFRVTDTVSEGYVQVGPNG